MAGGPSAVGAGVGGGSGFIVYFLTAFAAFAGFLFGYDTGTINGIQTMPAWLDTFGTLNAAGERVLTTSNQSLVVSILSAGNFVGALMAGPIGDRIGRRWGLMVASAVFSLGVGLQLAPTWVVFILGRVVAGLGVGLISSLCPLYQGETSPRKYRGLVVGLYQWAITIGILVAAIVNNSMQKIVGPAGWKTVIALQFAWAAILVGGLFFLPETPRYLALKGRDDQAKNSLRRITNLHGDDLEAEFALLKAGLAAEAEAGTASYGELFAGGPSRMRLRTLTAIAIQGWQQLTGINFIFYFGTAFFKASGIKDPFIVSVVTNVVNVVCTVPGLLIVDKVGRRPMLIWGAVGMAACEYIVAIVGVTKGNIAADGSVDLAAQRVLIAMVCIYIAFFAATWGPIAWTVCAEIFPSRHRGKGMSFSAASNWLWNFGIGYATPYLVNKSTPEIKAAGLGVKVFFLWGSTCAGCAIFAYFFVAETKGLSLEEVDELYRSTSMRNSNKWRAEFMANGSSRAHMDEMNLARLPAQGHGEDDIYDDKRAGKV